MKNKVYKLYGFNVKLFSTKISSIVLTSLIFLIIITFDSIIATRYTSVVFSRSHLDMVIIAKTCLLILLNGIYIINLAYFFYKLQISNGITDIELRYGLSVKKTYLLRFLVILSFLTLLLLSEFLISIIFFLVINSKNEYGTEANWYLVCGCYLLIFMFMVLFLGFVSAIIVINQNIWPIIYSLLFLFITLLSPFYSAIYSIYASHAVKDTKEETRDKKDDLNWSHKKMILMQDMKKLNYKLSWALDFDKFVNKQNIKQDIIKHYYEYIDSTSAQKIDKLFDKRALSYFLGLLLPYELVNKDNEKLVYNTVNENNIILQVVKDIINNSEAIANTCSINNTYLATLGGSFTYSDKSKYSFDKNCLLSTNFDKIAKTTNVSKFKHIYNHLANAARNLEYMQVDNSFNANLFINIPQLIKLADIEKDILDKRVSTDKQNQVRLFDLFKNNYMILALNSFFFEMIRNYIVSDHNVMQLFYNKYDAQYQDMTKVLKAELWNPIHLFNIMMFGGYQSPKVDLYRNSSIANIPPTNIYSYDNNTNQSLRSQLIEHYYNVYENNQSLNFDKHYRTYNNDKNHTFLETFKIKPASITYIFITQIFIILFVTALLYIPSFMLYKKSVKI